jgi:hypothetical protein
LTRKSVLKLQSSLNYARKQIYVSKIPNFVSNMLRSYDPVKYAYVFMNYSSFHRYEGYTKSFVHKYGPTFQELKTSIYGSTDFVGPWPFFFFSFLILYTVDKTHWTGDNPVAWPQPKHRYTRTQNKSTQTSMPRVGFEPRIPVFALDCTATMIGSCRHYSR